MAAVYEACRKIAHEAELDAIEKQEDADNVGAHYYGGAKMTARQIRKAIAERAAKPQEAKEPAHPKFPDCDCGLPSIAEDGPKEEPICQACGHWECNHEKGRCLIAYCSCILGGTAIGTSTRDCAWWLL